MRSMKKSGFISLITAITLAVVMLVPMLSGCAGGGGLPENFVTETSGTYGTIQWDYYKDPRGNFKVEIPVGWKVNMKEVSGGVVSSPSRYVEIKNPAETMGMWIIDFKHFYISQLSSLTVEAVLKEQIFSPTQNSTITTYELIGEKQVTPVMSDFMGGANAQYFKDAGRYRQHFVQKGIEGEGEAECVLMGNSTSSLTVSAILLNSIYASPMGEFDKWQPVLDRIRSTFSFLSYDQGQSGTANAGNNGGAIVPNTNYGGVYNPGTYDLSDSYTSRSNTNDINMQKWGDYMLDRTRVQDNSTGDIYYADQSWYDQYSDLDGQRYSQISGDQYLSDVSGTVGW